MAFHTKEENYPVPERFSHAAQSEIGAHMLWRSFLFSYIFHSNLIGSYREVYGRDYLALRIASLQILIWQPVHRTSIFQQLSILTYIIHQVMVFWNMQIFARSPDFFSASAVCLFHLSLEFCIVLELENAS